jgi:hypothetical protein
MGFAHPLGSDDKSKIIAYDSTSCGSWVEKKGEKLIEFGVLMHFESDFIFGSVFKVEKEGWFDFV